MLDDNYEDELEEEEDDDIIPHEDLSSEVDKQNSILFLRDILTHLQSSNKVLYEKFLSTMSPDDKTSLQVAIKQEEESVK